ncbi:MAG: indole-3-glycerol phosphate synthase TrpC [Candidatus Acidiferrum sp.]
MSDILQRIVASKRRELAAAKESLAEAELERSTNWTRKVLDFRGALMSRKGIQIIAEIKKASPSAGVLRADFDPVVIAREYERGGAACISVLTDPPFFQGSLEDLAAVRGAVNSPLLRKDFILDRYQLVEARRAGADAVLLIAEILPGDELGKLLRETQAIGLHALVEVYEKENLARVLDAGANLVGVNNRDLRTFETRLEHTLEIAANLPPGICLVSESGIRNRADIDRLRAANVRAVLIGETLMQSANVAAALAELRGQD